MSRNHGRRCNLCRELLPEGYAYRRCRMCRGLYSQRLHICDGDDPVSVRSEAEKMRQAIEHEHPGFLRHCDELAAEARRARHG